MMLEYAQPANASDSVRRTVDELLAAGRTSFQEYMFFRSSVHGTCISLDGDIQSCESDEGIYHEALVHPAMLLHRAPGTVLIMGGGEGATAREVLRHPTVEKLVMVDMDREFVDLCRKYIPGWSRGVWDDQRLEIYYEDINDYLDRSNERFDVVIGDLVDVSDRDSPAASLYSGEFYARLGRRLADDALIATQAGALGYRGQAGHGVIRDTLAAAFGHAEGYGMVVPSFYHAWGYVLASGTRLDISMCNLLERLTTSASERGIRLAATGVDSLCAAFFLPLLVSDRAG